MTDTAAAPDAATPVADTCQPLLSAIGIHKNYGDLPVLRGVDLVLYSGELVALVGRSGAGKTTLLQICGLLDVLDQGRLTYQGQDLSRMAEGPRARFRNRSLGFVFQFHHLLAEFTALDNVAMPAYIQGQDKARARRRAAELLDLMGLAARRDHLPSQLSGGEQQRVAVARALMNEPRLILADEPTGNLDTENGRALFALFQRLCTETGVAILMATHNEEFAAAAHRLVRIQDGNIVK